MLIRNHIILAFVLCIVLFILNTFRILDVIQTFNENQYNNYEIELLTITTNVKKVSDALYLSTINVPTIIDIFKNAHQSNDIEKNIIREKLYNTLKNNYEIFKVVGIQQLHFHLPNNDSFLRFHKPKKFGDNLTKIRESVRYVNENKKPIFGFEEGKIFNGYRFVYPLFDENKIHIGSVEISASLLSFKKVFQKTNKLQLDYILTKETVLNKVFESQLQNYLNYNSLKDFLIQTTLKENNDRNYQNDYQIDMFMDDKEIKQNILPIKKQFYCKIIDYKIYNIYFIPLLNDFTKKGVGYAVVFGESDYIKYFYKNIIISYSVFFFLSILISYILYRNQRSLIEKKEKDKFREEAYTDPLTQLCNRKFYSENLSEDIKKFKRYGTNFSVILCDIDHFKSINDNYGHNIGDKVLKEISNLLKSSFRSSDRVCRIGGEEFVILLPQLNVEQSLVLAEKIRCSVEKNLKTIEDKTITISLGVTEIKKSDTEDSIFKRVDEYLYQSKSNGRNMITSDLNTSTT